MANMDIDCFDLSTRGIIEILPVLAMLAGKCVFASDNSVLWVWP